MGFNTWILRWFILDDLGVPRFMKPPHRTVGWGVEIIGRLGTTARLEHQHINRLQRFLIIYHHCSTPLFDGRLTLSAKHCKAIQTHPYINVFGYRSDHINIRYLLLSYPNSIYIPSTLYLVDHMTSYHIISWVKPMCIISYTYFQTEHH